VTEDDLKAFEAKLKRIKVGGQNGPARRPHAQEDTMTLTREQVEQALEVVHDDSQGRATRGIAHNHLLDTDAALRQRVEELEQKYKDVCSGWDTQYVTGLETQVADLTTWLEIARDTCVAWHRYTETLTAKLAQMQEQRDHESMMHAACLTIAEGYPGWDVPFKDDSLATKSVRILRQQLAALQLHWLTKKPTVPGQYWWRSQKSVNGQKFPKVCHVFESNKVLYVEGLGVGSFYLKNASGEWAGPLVPPEEAT
jgi:hypothetical protein